MNDTQVFAAVFTPATMLPDPVGSLRNARRDLAGQATVWPTCSMSGHTDPLAIVIDPIDPLDPQHDSFILVTEERRRVHHAHVLAEAVWQA